MTLRVKLDDIFKKAVERGDVPGVAAFAVAGGDFAYEGAFGRRDLSKNDEMTVDTVVWIASMTKAITSVAAMQLVERGKLELDAPVSAILPELSSVQVLEGFDENGKPRLRPPRRPITLRHLLTHTSGFSYDIWNADIGRYMRYAGVPGIITCQNAALRTPLVADPGTRWEYGISIDWVGKLVEAVSAKRLPDYFEENIFGPLGMNDTRFVLSESQRLRLAGMHQRQSDGSFTVIPFEVPQNPEFFMGGGGLYGTGRDYMKFLRMFLNGGRANGSQILRPESVAAMTQNQIGELTVRPLKTAIPELSNDLEFWPGITLKWGLGFLINVEQLPTGRSPGGLAWAGLANTYFWLDLTKKVAGVFLSQILPFGDTRALTLFGEFERTIYQNL